MVRTFFFRVMAFIAALIVSFAFHSCVNSDYELSEENLDLNVTVFQEGVSIPLGSTAAIKLGEIVDKLELDEEIRKFLLTGENGEFSFSLKSEGPIDMSESLESLSGVVDIDAVDFSQNVPFDLSEINVDGFSTPAKSFGVQQDLSELLNKVPDMTGTTINYSQSINAGLYKYTYDGTDWNLGFGGLESGKFSPVLAKVPASLPFDLLPESAMHQPISLAEIETLSGTVPGSSPITMLTELVTEPVDITLSHSFPDIVRSVNNVVLSEDSELTVNVSLEDRDLFDAGEFSPVVDINLHELFHLSDQDNDKLDELHKDHIYETFRLNSENNWSASAVYGLKEIVMDGEGWSGGQNGQPLKLNRTMQITVSGELHYDKNELKTTPAKLKAKAGQEVKVNIEMSLSCKVADLVMTLNEKEVNIPDGGDAMKMPFQLVDVTLPEEVEGISDVELSDDSAIEFTLSAANLASMAGLDLKVKTLELAFPEFVKIENADEQTNVLALDLSDKDLRDGITEIIRIKGVEIPEGRDIDLGGEVQVSAVAVVGGTVHSEVLPHDEDDDLKFDIDAVGKIGIKDYTVNVGEISKLVEMEPETIAVDVPAALAEIGSVDVYLKNDPLTNEAPSIDIVIEKPDGLDVCAVSGGLSISLPELIRIKKDGSGNYPAGYDENTHSILFTDRIFSVSLPVEKVVLKPEPKADESGEYEVRGTVAVTGGIRLADGSFTKGVIDELKNAGMVSFTASVPALEAETLGVSSFSAPFKEEFEFKMLEDIEIPEMLAEIGTIELDDVYFSLGLKTKEDFPGLGEGSSLSFSAEISLPEYIVVDKDRLSQDGKLVIEGELTKVPGPGNAMQLTVEPLKIEAIKLDMTGEELAELGGKIEIDGNVKLTGASLVIDQWLGKSHSIDVTAGIRTVRSDALTAEKASEEDKILIKSVSGRIDYQLEPIDMNIDLSMLKELFEGENLSATIDLDTFYATLSLETNLGVPVKANLSAVPYYGGRPGEAVNRELAIEGARSAADLKKTVIYISDEEPGLEGGLYDKFIDIDLFSLLYEDSSKETLIDSIKLSVTAGTDASEVAVFEPSAKYVLKADYSAGIPVSFGRDFQVTYRDTLAGLPSEIGMLMGYGSLGLGGVVENSLPFNLSLSVGLLDSEMKPIPMREDAGKFRINSCDAMGNAVKTTLDLVLAAAEDADITDISALEFIFTIDSKDAVGVPVGRDSFLRVESLFARIPEGITLDLGELMSGEDEPEE